MPHEIKWIRAHAPEGQIGVITSDLSTAALHASLQCKGYKPLDLPVELFEGGLKILREAIPDGVLGFEDLPLPEGMDFAHMRAFDGLPKVRILRVYAPNEDCWLTRMDVKPICA
jgi:hypothetical protein